MTISTGGNIQITAQQALVNPAMDQWPLRTALENINYLWKWHRPPLVDLCPTTDPLQGRATIAIPIIPSVDGLPYKADLCIWATAATTFTGTIKYCTSYTGLGTTWTSWKSVSGGVSAAVLTLWNTTAGTLPATAVALQVDVQVAAGAVRVDHVLVYPAPGDAVAGIQPSGFVPFDDGMISATGSPIHTEHINRCKTSSLAVLRDRVQAAFSFAQVEGNAVDYDRSGSAGWRALPMARLWLPYQSKATLLWRVIASTSGGTTTDVVRVRQLGVFDPMAVLPTFDADRTIQTAVMEVTPQGSGAMRYVDLALEAERAGVSDSTRIHSAMAWWFPTY